MTKLYTYPITGSIRLPRDSKQHADESVYCVLEGIEEDSANMFGVELVLSVKIDKSNEYLTALQTKLLELKSNQEYMLREEYGVRWHQMTGTIAGSGYEVCEELLEMINGMMGES